ncbi:hypothetical protein SSX86_011839 [Deinandra increscens subsp. villosa]|uniref:DUF4005 domain-containing protein n=1 Tax=Deinandra increscens subsp. villosa TaxID=3103831 RepID=A0AAP0D747_9ASTR
MGRAITRWLKALFGIKRSQDSGDRKPNNLSCIRRSPTIYSVKRSQGVLAGGGPEIPAAVKIQSFFRGYLESSNEASEHANIWGWTPGYITNPNVQIPFSPQRHNSPVSLPLPSSQTHEFEWAPHLGPNQYRTVSPSKSDYPGYMANTISFNAKLRSQRAAPKQQPEFGFRYKKMVEPRNSVSCRGKRQRSTSQAQESISFKNAIAGRLGGHSNIRWLPKSLLPVKIQLEM